MIQVLSFDVAMNAFIYFILLELKYCNYANATCAEGTEGRTLQVK